MRTTWIILVLTLLAGVIMYFIANKPRTVAPDNTVSFAATPDSVRQKTSLYVVYDPAQVYFRDSSWTNPDSTPLRMIATDNVLTAFDDRHGSATFVIDYNHQYFYDIEISKPAKGQPFSLSLDLQPAGNEVQLNGIINSQNGKLDFSGPMMKMYKSFIMSYNARIPDSLKNTDSTMMNAEKVITIIQP